MALLRSSVLHHDGVESGAERRRSEDRHFEAKEEEAEGSPARCWEKGQRDEKGDGRWARGLLKGEGIFDLEQEGPLEGDMGVDAGNRVRITRGWRGLK